MSKMYFLLFFILICINVEVEAANSCNDECLTKTYCISSGGSAICSSNNLVTAQFKVIPVFGKYDYLQLTLKGYNVASDNEKTIKLSFDRPELPSNEYICYKSALGSTKSTFIRDWVTQITGSSYYLDGVLYCTWTFNIYDKIWPQFNSLPADMIRDSSQTISLSDDSHKIQVAGDTSQLPIFHVQYLKCCNKVHGNDDFVLTFDQIDKQIRYQFYYFKSYAYRMNMLLTIGDGMQLRFDYYLDSTASGSISNATKYVSIYRQLINPTFIYQEIYSWSTPFVLGDSTLNIDASTSVFNLEVQVDKVTIYIEKGVSLKNSSYLFKSSFILIAFAVLFQVLFIYSN